MSFVKYASFALGILAFGWLVWPTPYRYDHETLRAGQFARTTLIRINRLTGATETLGENGWYRP